MPAESRLCMHPHCRRPVAPKYLACRDHWYQLPAELRGEVWDAYRPGQEHGGVPTTHRYRLALLRCFRFWLAHAEASS